MKLKAQKWRQTHSAIIGIPTDAHLEEDKTLTELLVLWTGIRLRGAYVSPFEDSRERFRAKYHMFGACSADETDT